jgi:4-amino-4-deoxy-L-arabinose transferase-like glycosyltransferase
MKKNLFWLVLILVLASFLRFYNLSGYLQFLGDEGRDALVVKRMIVDHQWTLLGPTASVGGFYTGPVYYYFMLPFLWLFQLNPVGPAVMAALFGVATVALIYFFVKELVGEKAGIIAALLLAMSPKMIEISRFSWNPNPVPFFCLAAIYAVYKQKIFLAGILTGILVQLHYINVLFVPIVGVSILLSFSLKDWLKKGIVIIVGFLSGISPFLLFELRHGFPNTKSVLEFIFRDGATVAPRTNNFVELFVEIYRRTFENVFQIFASPVFNIAIYLCLVAFLLWAWRRGRKILPILVWLVIGTLGLGFYRGTLYEHYFNFLYILPFIILGVILSRHWILAIGVLILFYLSATKWFFGSPPNNLLVQTQAVDKIVIELIEDKPFNFALIAPGNSDHAYRYFLEVWGKKPVVILNPDLDPKRETTTGQLIVVCEQQNCAPLGHPQWEIAGFGRAEIVQGREGPAGIIVYKLVHYYGSG